MIKEVQNETDLKNFVYFKDNLYKDCSHYVCPIYKSEFHLLTEILFTKKTYKAILSVDETGKIKGRILFGYEMDQKENKEICFFSYFDAINEDSVVKEMFDYIYKDMASTSHDTISGPFAPFDPDTNRGLLEEGFDLDESLYQSYNFNYYSNLLLKEGFQKLNDAYTYNVDLNSDLFPKTEKIAAWYQKKSGITIEKANLNDPDKLIDDVYSILLDSQDELNYQDCPSREVIEGIFHSLKPLLLKDFCLLAKDKNGKPIGITLMLPEYNPVIKKCKGKIRILPLLYGKHHIRKLSGKIQYIIKEYQKSGVMSCFIDENYKMLKKHKITEVEVGVINEFNIRSFQIFDHIGAKRSKVFRIYTKTVK